MAIWRQLILRLPKMQKDSLSEFPKLRECRLHSQLVTPIVHWQSCRDQGHLSGGLQKSKINWRQIATGLEPASIYNSRSSSRINAHCAPSVCRLSGPGKTWETQPNPWKTFQNVPKLVSKRMSHFVSHLTLPWLEQPLFAGSLLAAQTLTESFLEHCKGLIHTPTSLLYVANNRCLHS